MFPGEVVGKLILLQGEGVFKLRTSTGAPVTKVGAVEARAEPSADGRGARLSTDFGGYCFVAAAFASFLL